MRDLYHPLNSCGAQAGTLSLSLMKELEQRQTHFVIAGRHTQRRGYAEGAGIPPDKLAARLFPTVGTAVRHYFRENPPEQKDPPSPTLGAIDSD